MHQANTTIQSTPLNGNSFSNNEASFSNMEEEELEVEKSDTRFSPEFSKSKDLNLDINERILLALPCHYSQKID